MPLTKDEFLESLYQIELKKIQLKELSDQRQSREALLAVEYKVIEANTKRSDLIREIAQQEQVIINEIKGIEATMAEKARA